MNSSKANGLDLITDATFVLAHRNVFQIYDFESALKWDEQLRQAQIKLYDLALLGPFWFPFYPLGYKRAPFTLKVDAFESTLVADDYAINKKRFVSSTRYEGM
jgi:hypothetical protein